MLSRIQQMRIAHAERYNLLVHQHQQRTKELLGSSIQTVAEPQPQLPETLPAPPEEEEVLPEPEDP